MVTAAACILVGFSAFANTSLAAEREGGVLFKSGTLVIKKATDLDFGEIQYNREGSYYYPTIIVHDWLIGAAPA